MTGYERQDEFSQRPSPEGLHAQKLRQDDATYGAGSHPGWDNPGDRMALEAHARARGMQREIDRLRAFIEKHEEGRCAEFRERVEPKARVREEPVPWYELREAVRATIDNLVADTLRDNRWDADRADAAIEYVCRAALREIVGTIDASACFVPGCQMPRHEAFAETWWTCREHAPAEAREQPKPIEKPLHDPHLTPDPVASAFGRLLCRLGLHKWISNCCPRCGKERS